MTASLSFLPGILSRLRSKEFRPALPFRLRGRPLSVAPTRYGTVFFFMLLALLVGSINHDNNLGYLLTFLLGSMALVSLFHTLRNILGFEVIAAGAAPVFAGQQAAFQLTVVAHDQDRPGIALSFPGEEPVTVTLPAGGKQSVTVFHRAEKRGVLEVFSLRAATSFPLSLFEIRSLLKLKASCLVYPRPVPGHFVTTGGPAGEDDLGESGGAGIDDFDSLASYQRGDPLQHISWKAFSKGHGLHTKKFTGQQGRAIYFNPDVLPGTDMEWKLSRICSMIIKVDALRLSYGLQLGDRFIPPDTGGSHKRHCLRELALFGQ